MKLILDTNRYCDFCRNDTETVELVTLAEEVLLPFVVVAELRAGFLAGTIGRKNEATLSRFLANARVSILYPDEQTTRVYAGIYAQLRAQGTPIPTNDLWIASLAVQHNLCLCSRDAHFDHIPQVARC